MSVFRIGMTVIMIGWAGFMFYLYEQYKVITGEVEKAEQMEFSPEDHYTPPEIYNPMDPQSASQAGPVDPYATPQDDIVRDETYRGDSDWGK